MQDPKYRIRATYKLSGNEAVYRAWSEAGLLDMLNILGQNPETLASFTVKTVALPTPPKKEDAPAAAAGSTAPHAPQGQLGLRSHSYDPANSLERRFCVARHLASGGFNMLKSFDTKLEALADLAQNYPNVAPSEYVIFDTVKNTVVAEW